MFRNSLFLIRSSHISSLMRSPQITNHITVIEHSRFAISGIRIYKSLEYVENISYKSTPLPPKANVDGGIVDNTMKC